MMRLNQFGQQVKDEIPKTIYAITKEESGKVGYLKSHFTHDMISKFKSKTFQSLLLVDPRPILQSVNFIKRFGCCA